MNSNVDYEAQPEVARQRFAAPIWTLLLLAPFIAEVLSGSTRTSVLFVFVPEVMVWGVGALVCRDLVRRWRAGVPSLLALGLALSVAEEWIIQQTSLAPLPFPGSHADYGRIWGVNLVYFLFMLGFESVWVVVVPVHVTELFFSRCAAVPWLRKRGAVVAGFFFLIGSWIAWYGWTQQARPRLHAAPYHPPVGKIVLGLLIIAGLIVLAYLLRNVRSQADSGGRGAVPAWPAGVISFVLGGAWFELIGQQFAPNPVRPFWIVIAAGIAWTVIAWLLFRWMSSSPAWSKSHIFAATFGATLACMAAPYLSISSWSRIDVIGVVIFDIVALAVFAVLAKKVFSVSSLPTPAETRARSSDT